MTKTPTTTLSDSLQRAKALIRDVPDFPKKGILFKDVTPLLQDGPALKAVLDGMADHWRGPDGKPTVDVIAGMESRGFIFGTGLALAMGIGFIPIRKKGKLPYKTESIGYGLEYGTDQLEIHVDACPETQRGKQRVLVCDDLIATGGTAQAAATLIERIGGVVAGFSFVIELQELKGREKLGNRRSEALFVY
jgi:adenine phosphoribosyltransferase